MDNILLYQPLKQESTPGAWFYPRISLDFDPSKASHPEAQNPKIWMSRLGRLSGASGRDGAMVPVTTGGVSEEVIYG